MNVSTRSNRKTLFVLYEKIVVKGQFMGKRLISICIALMLVPALAVAAPPFLKGNPEPPEYPGKHINTRLAEKLPVGVYLAPATYPATVNVLFLKVEFQQESPDNTTTTGDGTWADCTTACNGDPDYWVNNAQSNFIAYWDEVSYGMLTVNVTISTNVYPLSGQMADYPDEDETNFGIESLISDSISAADADIDFNSYDAVLIVHAGAGQEADINRDTPYDIWSLYYYRSSPIITTDDGTPINEAIIMPQTDSQDGIDVDPLGVYVHEFGHWLGLPDLYCTSGFSCLLDGVGEWSLMGDGIYNADPSTCAGNSCLWGSAPAHPIAWSRVFLGWAVPQILSPDADHGLQSLEPVEYTAVTQQPGTEVIKLQASTSEAAEYFLVEHRKLTGLFDVGLPGFGSLQDSGLLIWLIDDNVIGDPDNPTSNFFRNTINNSVSNPGVKLMEADGDFALLNAADLDYGSAGDPFPGSTGNTDFTPQSDPASLPYTDDAWVNVHDIAINGGIAEFSVGFSPDVPASVSAATDCDSMTTTLSWTAPKASDVASYRVYKNGSLDRELQGTSATFTGNSESDVYRVSAMDTNGYESAQSNSVSPFAGCSDSGSSGCFIATAAYGSYMADDVMVLRKFRDEHLLTNPVGRALVRLYYAYSPRIADYIAEHDALKTTARIVLTPVVYIVQYPFVFGFIVVMGGVFVVRRRVRR